MNLNLTAMLKVQNFLYCFGIRTGTLLILWFQLIFSVSVVGTCSVRFPYIIQYLQNLQNMQNVQNEDLLLILVLLTVLYLMILINYADAVLAALALFYLPSVKDRKHSRESGNAKYIKYFALYNCVVNVMILSSFAAIVTILSVQTPSVVPESELMQIHHEGAIAVAYGVALLFTMSAGIYLYFGAVTFSYYESITVGHYEMSTMSDDLKDKNSVQVDRNVEQAYGMKF